MKDNMCHTGSSNCGRILGGIFLIVATILTFIHIGSEGGTLGMFIAAAVLLKRSGCGTCGRCGVCACCCACNPASCGTASCDVSMVAPAPAKKVAKTRKAKKTV